MFGCTFLLSILKKWLDHVDTYCILLLVDSMKSTEECISVVKLSVFFVKVVIRCFGLGEDESYELPCWWNGYTDLLIYLFFVADAKEPEPRS